MSKAFRTAVATLLIALFATLAGAAPSFAKPVQRQPHAQSATAKPARAELGLRGVVVALLSGIFDFAGGAMDPNGVS
jgi:photosystem II stability/assembly factor-like uncharacterized protein